LKDLNSKLKILEKQLQQEIDHRKEAEENLALFRAKLDNINSIAHKYS